MGIRPTLLPWLVLAAGLAGAAVALLLQWWTNAVNYPLIISGKPLFSLPANIPIVFELIVLFAALAAFGGALGLNRLPQFWHPAFGGAGFARVTSDGFFLFVDAADRKFDEAALRRLAQSLGAAGVESCFEPRRGPRLPQGDGLDRPGGDPAEHVAGLVDRAVAAAEIAHAAAGDLLRHGLPAQVQGAGGQRAVCRRPGDAAARARHGPLGRPGGRRPPLPRQVRRQVGDHLPHDPRPRHDGARTGAVQYLLRRLPRLDRRGRRPDLRVGGQARPGGDRRRSQADLGQAHLVAIDRGSARSPSASCSR